jgi:hypothetical protein
MRLVAIATHSERYLPMLQESCRRYGAKLELLCWGEKWRGLGQKLTAMLDFLTPLPEDEVVCMLDAFDTVLLQPPEVLEHRFRKTGAKMVIAVDGEPPNCIVRYFVKRVFPPIDGVYTNAGTYIGYAGHMRRLLKHVITSGENTNNDQEMIAQFCRKHEGWLKIDVQSELFLTFYTGSSWSFTNELTGSLAASGIEVVEQDDKPALRTLKYETMPCVLHAPCDGNINVILEQLGYTMPQSVLDYGVLDHAGYMWKCTKAYLPLIWDSVIMIALLVVLAIAAIFILARRLVGGFLSQAQQHYYQPQPQPYYQTRLPPPPHHYQALSMPYQALSLPPYQALSSAPPSSFANAFTFPTFV